MTRREHEWAGRSARRPRGSVFGLDFAAVERGASLPQKLTAPSSNSSDFVGKELQIFNHLHIIYNRYRIVSKRRP